MTLTEPQIRRYARHVLLPDVGGIGQARLLAATVTIDLDDDPPAAIVAATYLAAAGVGTLALAGGARAVTAEDVDTGIALGVSDLGRPLPSALTDRLHAINPEVTVLGTDGATGAMHRPPVAVPGTVADALVRGGLSACRTIHRIATGAS